MAEFLEAGRSLVLERGGGTQAVGLGHVGAQSGMGRLLAVQAPCLGDQQAQQHHAGRTHGVGFDLPNHFQHIHHSQGAHIM